MSFSHVSCFEYSRATWTITCRLSRTLMRTRWCKHFMEVSQLRAEELEEELRANELEVVVVRV